jgi:outer membrane protein OmpA-like peptidoglycan-associated protein
MIRTGFKNIFTLFLVLLASQALSDEDRRVYSEGEVPTVDDLVSILGGEPNTPPKHKSKLGKRKSFSDSAVDQYSDELSDHKIVVSNEKEPIKTTSNISNDSNEIKPVQSAPKVVSIPIVFKINSDVLAVSEAAKLRNMAEAINKIGASSKLLIEGHTDSTGSEIYNKKLSLQRAKSVKKQLVNLGVSSDQLIVTGAGSSKLLNKSNPAADVNRRVEFTRISTLN